MGIRWDPVSTWYLLVVTAGLLRSQTHDWVLWWGITEADTVLTSPAVSRAGIKIWHPQWSSVDTNWAWSQRKCLSPPLSTQPFCPHHKKRPLTSFISLYFISILVPRSPLFSPKHPSPAAARVLSIPPSLLPLVLRPPTCKSFPVHNTDFLPTFLPSLNISLCGTVALDFCDDFILPLLAWVAVNSSGEWGLLRVASAVCYK